MSGARAKVFRTGGGQAVQLPQELGFPEGQTEVLVKREGNRLILEPIVDDWPEEFRACIGAWTEEIERPLQSSLHELSVASESFSVATGVSLDEGSGVSAFFGRWPGEETEEELMSALKAIG